ncbi:D-alanine--D-alanine ligase [Candidatus Albibeggiatoa sp. nov. NOAA]|uniref:D-alanine--D-alanine ligase n=1 Tax=Candidatus Albibeggiatoa sp. nov. NOAA TaxID=3162724 RepID=UPI0032FB8F30|nr:D-alanine--D-alanine ligase [Thiotrichaceae bacterium]
MTTMQFGKVAVLMGGNSAERVISLKSGQAVLEALLQQGIDAIGVDTATQLHLLTEKEIDTIFIALHGRGGEDGTIQGYLETLNLPYTGSRILGSALAMDKLRTKQIWQATEFPTPTSVILDEYTDFNEVAELLGLPLMVKPVLEGSSVGMAKVKAVDELKQAWQQAAEYQCTVIAEKFVTGVEYTVAILHNRALPIIRLETPRDFYDFAAKYTENTTQYICPCGLSEMEEQKLQNLALRAFNAVSASGWGRVDMICDEQGQPYLLEVNTVPGMTDHSLVPMAANVSGVDFGQLCVEILKTAKK